MDARAGEAARYAAEPVGTGGGPLLFRLPPGAVSGDEGGKRKRGQADAGHDKKLQETAGLHTPVRVMRGHRSGMPDGVSQPAKKCER